MYKIVEKTDLAGKVFQYVLEAPDIARKARPGQFVILRLNETGERIPITIADSNPIGTITLYVQAVGKTTTLMSHMKTGDAILDVAGPLGMPSQIEKVGTVVAIGGGFGVAAMYPIVREHTRIGNKTISLLGARTHELIILEDEMRKASSEIRIATNDGSYGKKGIVTDLLMEMISRSEPIDLVIAIGPPVMMKAVAEITRPGSIKTIASMNPIMMDGTGMCGACRVMVGKEMKFACVDGPEFDAHLVDFDALLSRLKMYLPEEKLSLDEYLLATAHDCRLEQQLKR
jgi:NAD(P)H-flavin reductase